MNAFRRYIAVLGVLILVTSAYLPKRYGYDYPKSVAPEFDPKIRRSYSKEIDAERPEILMLGDSMLVPAIDGARVAEELGQSVKMIGRSGTSGTVWYLMLKNDILQAEHPPKTILILFRDTMLTVPGYRTTGRYFDLIDEFANSKDTVLIQRAYLNQMNPVDKFAEAYLPIYSARWNLRTAIDSRLRYGPAGALMGCDKTCAEKALEIFGTHNLDPDLLSNQIAAADNYLYEDDHMDFDAQVDKSFLPEIIRLCRERGIQLVLVREHIQRFVTPGSVPGQLYDYFDKMQAYLDQNGVIFLDYGWDSTYTQEYYIDNVHLNEKGQARFTTQLIEDLMNALK